MKAPEDASTIAQVRRGVVAVAGPVYLAALGNDEETVVPIKHLEGLCDHLGERRLRTVGIDGGVKGAVRKRRRRDGRNEQGKNLSHRDIIPKYPPSDALRRRK